MRYIVSKKKDGTKKSIFINGFYIMFFTVIFAFVIPYLIDYLYKIPAIVPIFDTGLEITDALSYYFSFLGAFGTITLGVLALYQNKVFKDANDENQQNIQLATEAYNTKMKVLNEELLFLNKMKYRIELTLSDYTYETTKKNDTGEVRLMIYFIFNNINANSFIYNIEFNLESFVLRKEDKTGEQVDFTNENYAFSVFDDAIAKTIVNKYNNFDKSPYNIDLSKNQFIKAVSLERSMYNYQFCLSNWELKFNVSYKNTLGEKINAIYTFETGYSQYKDFIKLVEYKEAVLKSL